MTTFRTSPDTVGLVIATELFDQWPVIFLASVGQKRRAKARLPKRREGTLDRGSRGSESFLTHQLRKIEIPKRKWRNSAVIGGKQRRFRLEARTSEEAIEESISLIFESKEKEKDPRFIEVEEMFLRWMAVRKLQDTTETDYKRYIELFLDWLRMAFPNLLYWSDLRLEHLELYTKFLGSEERTKVKGRNKRRLSKLTSRDSYRLYTHAIRACAEWASVNWEDTFRNFSVKYELPDIETKEKPKLHIPLSDVPALIQHLEENGKSPEIVAAICLQAVLGMRETEVLRLIWEEHLFPEIFMLRYTARAKNKYSRRYLPLPTFVVEVLSKVPLKTGSLVVGFDHYSEYSKVVRRWIKEWDPQYTKLPCSDLRNTLITTAYSQKEWNLSLLERFVGHKGNVDSLRREARERDISLDHYVTKDLDFLFQEYQEQIIPKIDGNLTRSSGEKQNSTKIAQHDNSCTKDHHAA